MVTRFHVRTNRPTQRLSLHVSSIFPLPKSYVDAFNDLNWQNAMNDEYNELIKNNTWTLVPQLTEANVIQCIFVTGDSLRMFLSQRKYAIEILKHAHMVGCNSSRTPVDAKSKLGDGGDPVLDLALYRSLAGSLYAKAKYRGVANVVAETCWLRNLLCKLHTPLSSSTLVYCDNVSDVYLSCNLVQHHRTKHIEIDIYFVRDLVTAVQVRVLHVPSRYQFADIFTKGLPFSLSEKFRTSLSVQCSLAPTMGEC
ncbi:ribonuclease H-like domain-containing protein [Tanacetum coccineum]